MLPAQAVSIEHEIAEANGLAPREALEYDRQQCRGRFHFDVLAQDPGNGREPLREPGLHDPEIQPKPGLARRGTDVEPGQFVPEAIAHPTALLPDETGRADPNGLRLVRSPE